MEIIILKVEDLETDQNPNKYKDDAIILEQAYFNENTDLSLTYRYAYYCTKL